MTHRLSIGAIETRCAFLGDPVAADALRLTLNRVLREVLPHILSEAADPVLKDARGVIRIRKLQLRIDLTVGLELRDIARLIAARIVAALRGLMQRRSDQVATWPDEASYTAAYVMHRLGLAQAPNWAFPDFSALRYLPDQDAAVEVLAQRPDALQHLADQAAGDGAVEAIATRLSVSNQRALLQRMTQHHPVRPRMTDILEQAIAFLEAAHWDIIESVSPQNRLFVLLSKLLTHGIAIRDAAILATLFDALAGDASSQTSTIRDTATTGDLDKLIADIAQRLSLPEIALSASDRTAQRGLQALISALRRQSSQGAPAQTSFDQTNASQQSGPIHSQFAGLALLLPSLRRLGLHHTLDPRAFAEATSDLFPPEDQNMLHRDPFMSLIKNIESKKARTRQEQTLSDQKVAYLRSACSSLFREGIPETSVLLLADFAAQLPGLQGSSCPYLLREFLTRPGRIEQTETALIVDITDMSLGVVLQMGGHLGSRGPIWQDGPNLTILLKGRTT